ncbi:hypothetical protein TYRP_016698 [Tyrophagus putrescentiae]|nr:hypothetical protein TYRP_016698 [Tyrophagus putrescentiae]
MSSSTESANSRLPNHLTNGHEHSCKDAHSMCCRRVHMPLLTDMYQITMAYSYWKNKQHNQRAIFDIFFRKNPFGGEFTVFAGLEECLNFLQGFSYSPEDIDYFRSVLPPTAEDEFFDYMAGISANGIKLYSVAEGTVVFPKEPLMRIEGPLAVCQLLETSLLTLVNFPSLVATNAARYCIAIDDRNIQLYEFGLRRAQGPDGGLSASKYTYIGGFDGTSNMLAGQMFGIPTKGTHAHSFIMSHAPVNVEESTGKYMLKSKRTDELVDFYLIALEFKAQLSKVLNISGSESSSIEFIAFISYAHSFPNGFMALVDTYDLIKSGILNFCAVALALDKLGYRAVGIRIDSGDLAYQSIVAYNIFSRVAKEFNLDWFSSLTIIVSNDINEETIISLNEQKHRINALGIGTHLVTCQKQPALGCVYKLVEVGGTACIKLSQDVEKVTIPSRKNVYRLYGREGFALLDLMTNTDEEEPQIGQKILCRHPFQESKRCYATPSRVEKLLQVWWANGKLQQDIPSLNEIRARVKKSLSQIRPDIKRLLNPTPYKVSVTDNLYLYMHKLWLENAPVGELH